MRSAPWLLVVACLLPRIADAQYPPVDATATVRQLHATMIKPASEVIFNVGREAPGTIETWFAIYSAAITLTRSKSSVDDPIAAYGSRKMDQAVPATWRRRARGP